ncbi:MAG: shikimate kinase [Agathobacter sp.]|nr:shikimate kinase [Agathobacter sp.]
METNKQKNIFLIGFMGCGKSTMARLLANELQMELIEMDETIEKEEQRSINDIFATDGEQHFRDLETQLIKRIAQKGGMVVSCGGGAILRLENVKSMKENGSVVYLCATPETIFQRVRHSTNRPLLNGNMNVEYIGELMAKRIDKYEAAADYKISVDEKEKLQVLDEMKSLFSL